MKEVNHSRKILRDRINKGFSGTYRVNGQIPCSKTGGSGLTVSTGNIDSGGGTVTFTDSQAVIITFGSFVNQSIIGFRSGVVSTIVSSDAIAASADETAYTVTNNAASGGARYILFQWT